MTALPSLLSPPDLDRESVIDDMVGMVRGVVAARRDPAYGALVISDDQVRELSNAIVAHVLAGFRVEGL